MKNIEIVGKEQYEFDLKELQELVDVAKAEQCNSILLNLYSTSKQDDVNVACYATAQFFKNGESHIESYEFGNDEFSSDEMETLRDEVIAWNK